MKFSEWLIETKNIPQLRRHIEQGFPDTKKRQHITHEVKITKLQYIPITYNNILRIQSESLTDGGNVHKQLMDIVNVTFQPPNSENTVGVTDELGRERFVTPVELNVHNVKVNCDCKDYEFRFANFNIQNKCHLGPPPPPYVRKTTTRPEVNPMKVPGMCKHLLRVTEDMQKQGILI